MTSTTDTRTTRSPATAGVPGSDYDKTLTFDASPDVVFDALTTTDGLSGWWVPVTGSGLEGGELRFQFGHGTKVTRVDQAERPSAVRWSVLRCEPAPDWEGTTISFDISATADGGSRLEFRHAGLVPELECYSMCSQGWDYYLPSLVDFVDTGQGRPASRGA